MRRLALLPLAAILVGCATTATSPALVVTFDRATTSTDAVRLVHQLAPSAETELDFSPVVLGNQLDGQPSAEVLEALFASGAVSVEVTSTEALAAAVGLEWPPGSTRLPGGEYLLRVEYAGTMPTDDAVARYTQAVGRAPKTVEVRANEIRVAVASAEAEAVAEQLRARPEVIDVRPDRP